MSSSLSSPTMSCLRSPRATASSFQYEFKWFKDDFDTNPSSRGRTFENRSEVEERRSAWEPPIPRVFSDISRIMVTPSESLKTDADVLVRWPEFGTSNESVIITAGGDGRPVSAPPTRYGIITTGEWVPASGTHNVIVGIVRSIFAESSHVEVLGFLGGPQGFARRHYVRLTPQTVQNYLNQGGADLLGFGSLRAMDDTDYTEIAQLAKDYRLSGIVFIGGPNELSHVSQLLWLTKNSTQKIFTFPTIVSVFQSPNSNVFVPEWIPVTLGFDSTRAALAELVGNIAMDGVSGGGSAVDVNFVRCGSTTLTVELAMHVRPAYAVIAEELAQTGMDLPGLIEMLSLIISTRQSESIPQSTILVSDKFYECLPGLDALRAECRRVYANRGDEICAESRNLLEYFLREDQSRLLRAYDVDGTPTWPAEAPEALLARLVGDRLNSVCRSHYIGPEGRCPIPTNFDCSLGLTLGYTAGVLVTRPSCHGQVAVVKNVTNSPHDWVPGGIPLASLLRAPVSTLLDHPFSNQELINLAQQRVLREASVPRITLRTHREGDDCLMRAYAGMRGVDAKSAFPYQPGPYQWESGNGLPFALTSGRTSTTGSLSVSPLSWPRPLDAVSETQRLRRDNGELLSRASISTLFRRLRTPLTNTLITPRKARDKVRLRSAFPHTSGLPAVTWGDVSDPTTTPSLVVGIVFIGKHAPGIHNVVWGIQEFLRDSKLIGFRGGVSGLERGDSVELTEEIIRRYRNQSGNDLLGGVPFSVIDFDACISVCAQKELDSLIVIGDGSGMGAMAELSERLSGRTNLIFVPASIQNNIPFVDLSVGHSTACAVQANVVGSLATLAASSKRQWCFVQLAGCDSQVVAAVSRRTNPNMILLPEEINARMDISDIVDLLADLANERAARGFDYGVVLMTDTVLDSVIVERGSTAPQILESLVRAELQRRQLFRNKSSANLSSSFCSSTHSLCHIGRSSLPNDVDAVLGFAMGAAAAALIAQLKTGLVVTVDLPDSITAESILKSRFGGYPLSALVEGDDGEYSIRPKKITNLHSVFPPGPPASRRFIHPGTMQFGSPEPAPVSPSTQTTLKQIEAVARHCSQLMALSATVGDKPTVDMIKDGLGYIRSVINARTFRE
jgi:6-phosphofructokinase